MSSLRSCFVMASLVATVLFPRVSSAMSMAMYDEMGRQDQQDYLAFLVKATQDVLIGEGRPDVARKVHDLVQGRGDDRPSQGEVQFEEVLARMRAYLAENPGPIVAPTVEGAWMQTLINNGIQLSHQFDRAFHLVVREKPFWPKRPLKPIRNPSAPLSTEI